ncbi:MAG: hypothetical protein AB1502_02020 [Thermodesulfobacteriota bacterium]
MMNGEEIKKILAGLDVLQTEIAKSLGIPKGIVSEVIYGIRSTNRGRQAIEDAVGKSVEELWGNGMSISNEPSSDLSTNPILFTFELTDREGFFATREMGNAEPKEMFIPLFNFIRFLPRKSPPLGLL